MALSVAITAFPRIFACARCFLPAISNGGA